MVTKLLRTKLYIPRSGPVAVPRSHLLQRLNEGLERDVTLVVAPVGYGKTTLVAEWVRQLDRPVAWLSLDRGDDDLATFLAYVIAAIDTVFPAACPDLRGLLSSPQLPAPQQLVRVWANEIDDLPQQLVLVLDDYHALADPQIHQLVDELLRHPLLQLHLVLVTRTEPPLAIGRLRANRRLNELRMGDLRFLPHEVTALFASAAGARQPDRVLEALLQRTEGWPAGLHLATLSLRSAGDDPAALDKLTRASNSFIMDYLFEQVLAQQPPAVHAFLIKTSILDRLSQPLAAAVTGAQAGAPQVALKDLAEAGLFLAVLDADGEWYSYHALFRELLRHHLRLELDRPQIADLHRRAGRWLCSSGFYDEALDHALAAGDEGEAVRIVVDNLVGWLEHDDWRTIDRRLNLFPRATIERQPWLLLAKAMVLRLQFRWHALLPVLEQAEEQLAAQEHELAPGEHKLLRGYLDTIWAAHYSLLADAEQTIRSARRALEAVPETHLHAHGLVQITLTMALQTSGRLAAAEKLLQGVIDRALANGYDRQALLQPLLCLMCLHFAEGHVARAQELAAMLLERAQAAGAALYELWSHLALGAAAYETSDLERAAWHYAAGAAQHLGGHARSVHECMVGLVLTYAAQGKTAEARREMAILAAFHRDLLNPLLTIEGASLARRLGFPHAQPEFQDSAKLGVSLETAVWYGWAEIPAETQVRLALQDPDGDRAAAAVLLERLLAVATDLHKPQRQAVLLALQAILLERSGARPDALRSLRKALELGEPRGFVRSFVDLSPAIDPLLRLAATDSPYAAQLLAACNAYQAARRIAASEPDRAPARAELTRREREVLALLAERRTDREIAAALVVSPVTVRTHIENLSAKLQAKGRRAIVTRAHELGWLE